MRRRRTSGRLSGCSTSWFGCSPTAIRAKQRASLPAAPPERPAPPNPKRRARPGSARGPRRTAARRKRPIWRPSRSSDRSRKSSRRRCRGNTASAFRHRETSRCERYATPLDPLRPSRCRMRCERDVLESSGDRVPCLSANSCSRPRPPPDHQMCPSSRLSGQSKPAFREPIRWRSLFAVRGRPGTVRACYSRWSRPQRADYRQVEGY